MHQRLGDSVEQRRHSAGRSLLVRAGVAPHDSADLAEMELLREGRRRRHGGDGEEPVQLARRARQELAVGGQDLGGRLDGPEGRPADDGADLVQPEQERGDDSEVAAAAADRPVEVRILVGGRPHALAAREHDIRLEQVVDRKAVLARQVAEAAPEREAPDAGRRDDPARRGKAVLVGGPVDLAPGAAAADPDRPGLRVDLDPLHRGEVDHDAVVARPEAGPVVPAAAYGDQEVVVARKADHLGDVLGACAARDQRGVPVDHRVVDLAGGAVAGVVRPDQLPLEPRELLARGLCW